jgi:hypothetical protein
MLGLVLALAGVGLDLVLGFRTLRRLGDSPPHDDRGAPLVSIVVAARNEARGIEAATRSLLAQRYPAFEIVAVDDRSTDATGAILDRLSALDPRLGVLHVRELPPGWLGKNHALSLGAAAARGEWLLFTDADVVLAPDAVARAVGFAERHGRDHLAVLPELRMPGLFLQAFVTAFICVGAAALRPWTAGNPRRRRSVGIGAFNLVRAASYQRAGGHTPIRLRPDDDLKLGKLLKLSGARAELLIGRGAVSVEWYSSLREAIGGLMKNAFALAEYRPLLMLLGAPLYPVCGLAPLAALLAGSGPLRLLGGAGVALTLALMLWGTRQTGAPRRAALLYPGVSLLFGWIVLRALALNLWQGGIVWRGTFYPLVELRRNRV